MPNECDWRATRGSLEYIALNAICELLPGEPSAGDPKVRGLALRLGLLGEAPKTLEEAGRVANLTRERIRQIQKEVQERLPLGDPPAALRDAIAFVHDLLPGEVTAVGRRLHEAGFADGSYSPEGLARLAALFGLSVPYTSIGGSGVSKLVVGTESPLVGGVEQVLATAEVLDGRLHLVSARTVGEALRTNTPEVLHDDDVDLILSSSDRWLPLDGGWFYRMGAPKCSLNGQSRSMLSWAPELTVAQLREGLRRRQAGRSWQPPPSSTILASFYERDPRFEFHDGRVRLAESVKPDTFEGANALIVAIFTEADEPALTRNQFMEGARRKGIPLASAQHYVTYSPLIERVSHNVWTLLGTVVPAGLAESLRDQARTASRPPESASGVDSQGHPWFAFRLRPTELNSGVLSLDKMTALLIEGLRFSLSTTMEGGSAVWNISTSERFLYGLIGLIGRFDPEPGDVLRLVFDVHDLTACATLGSDELLT